MKYALKRTTAEIRHCELIKARRAGKSFFDICAADPEAATLAVYDDKETAERALDAYRSGVFSDFTAAGMFYVQAEAYSLEEGEEDEDGDFWGNGNYTPAKESTADI